MKKSIAIVATVLALAACGPAPSGDGDKDALPQATPTATAEESTAAPKEAEPKASTCDVAREAFLTGSPADITKALKALIKDKKADATAREYADYYLNRDKGQPDLQDMDKTLIQSACSL